jgi:hypothetical protein
VYEVAASSGGAATSFFTTVSSTMDMWAASLQPAVMVIAPP